jgi:prepilin-type processing-associated H-X9-DG protein
VLLLVQSSWHANILYGDGHLDGPPQGAVKEFGWFGETPNILNPRHPARLSRRISECPGGSPACEIPPSGAREMGRSGIGAVGGHPRLYAPVSPPGLTWDPPPAKRPWTTRRGRDPRADRLAHPGLPVLGGCGPRVSTTANFFSPLRGCPERPAGSTGCADNTASTIPSPLRG